MFVASDETDAVSTVTGILEIATGCPWQHHSPLGHFLTTPWFWQVILLVRGFNKKTQFENHYNLHILYVIYLYITELQPLILR